MIDMVHDAESALAGAISGAAAGSVVPGLGTVLGGLLGLAHSLVPLILSPASQPALSEAAQVITGADTEPEQMAVLSADASALQQYHAAVLKIAADQQAATDAARTQQIIAALLDVQDARRQTEALAAGRSPMAWAAPALSVVIVLGFFGSIAGLLFAPVVINPNTSAMLNVLIGGLGAAFIAVTNYWLGSSAGSARKTELLAQTPRV